MKGLFDCNNAYYENVHELPELLENVETVFKPSEECETSGIYLSTNFTKIMKYDSINQGGVPAKR